MIRICVAVLLATTFAAPAFADCRPLKIKSAKTIEIQSDDFVPTNKLYIVGELPGPFIVHDQNLATCKVAKRKMSEDQMFEVYGVSDGLETGSID